jgi:hypothetical protein
VRHGAFLIIHVFYCIHDWRRMGYVDSDLPALERIVVPRFTSLLRTLQVDLRAIPDLGAAKKWSVGLRPPNPAGDSPQTRLDTLVGKGHYEILVDDDPIADPAAAIHSIEDFRKVLIASWSDAHRWKGHEL